MGSSYPEMAFNVLTTVLLFDVLGATFATMCKVYDAMPVSVNIIECRLSHLLTLGAVFW